MRDTNKHGILSMEGTLTAKETVANDILPKSIQNGIHF